MPVTLLETKFFVPPVRPDHIPRPLLIEKLNRGLHRKLTLISAPAGFGKTSLVSEWLSLLPGEEYRTAWLSLEESESSSASFLLYFISALRRAAGEETTIGTEALSLLRQPQSIQTDVILTSLMNDLSGINGSILIVLDDYHILLSSAVDEILTFFIKHLPPLIHLVITTREDPNFPLARLRARDNLTELRAADLRFTNAETSDFLQQILNVNLPEEHIAALENRTEGWIAGLQMAALSMQAAGDTAGFIKSFTGSHRLVLEYLLEEVLNLQSAEIQDFLIRTSVLSRMTGTLCDVLTGRTDGGMTLETLDRTNLFLVPLDNERCWYRYHHLFGELLRERLRQKGKAFIQELQRTAGEWFEKNGFADEAIDLAVASGEYETAADLLEKHIDLFWQQGKLEKMHHWTGSIPSRLIRSHQMINIIHAWLLFMAGRGDEAELNLKAAEAAAESGQENSGDCRQYPERAVLKGRLSVIRASIAMYGGNMSAITGYARKALDCLPEEDMTWRSLAAGALGDALGFTGDMEATLQARMEALGSCRAAGNIHAALAAGMKVAITQREMGHLSQTREVCGQQIKLAEEHGLSNSRINGWAMSVAGETAAEMNDLEKGTKLAEQGLELAEQSTDLSVIGWARLCMLRILFSRNNLDGMKRILEKNNEFGGQGAMPPWLMGTIETWKVRIWLAEGAVHRAVRWMESHRLYPAANSGPVEEAGFFELFDYIHIARTMILGGRPADGIRLLLQLKEIARAGSRLTREIEILCLLASARLAAGEASGAFAAIEQALGLAQPEGFFRIFLDEGQPMAKLLYEAALNGIEEDYIRRILPAFPDAGDQEPGQAEAGAGQVRRSGLFEPLSSREIEVLRLMGEGMTNQEIGERLFISVHTVKVHTRNIYGKLDSRNRTEAAAKARTLGILPPL